jgi:coenzyme F420 biosynthesis associated uncharacterized protein
VAEPVDWGLAEAIALRTTGREPFAESYHYDSLASDFERLTTQAEGLVEAATGLRSLAGPARARVTDRGGWVSANIGSFRRMLRPLTERLGDRLTGPIAPFASRIAGAEVGLLLGFLSGRVLGQYDLLIVEDENPDDQDIVYFVGPNVIGLEKRFGFPPEEFRLWLALHEVTHRMQFTGVPWLRPHFLGLVHRALSEVDPDPKRFLVAIQRIAEALRQGRNPLDDGGVVTLIATPAQEQALQEIGGLMSLLEGHGDVTMDRAGHDLIPSAGRFSRVLKQRRRQLDPLSRFLVKLIGLEAKMNQYEQGERFIARVEDVGGQDLLNLAFAGPQNLPTLDEIRAPDRWIDRVRPADTAA